MKFFGGFLWGIAATTGWFFIWMVATILGFLGC